MKLLGVTALTAGWMYTIQVVCLALVPSFVYSIWALAVCHKRRKMEFLLCRFACGNDAATLVAVHELMQETEVAEE